MTTATQLASALAALSNIAHPKDGTGFRTLRQMARRELASQQVQAIVTKAQLSNADGALANWKPLASGGASGGAPDRCLICAVDPRPIDCPHITVADFAAGRSGIATSAAGDHNAPATQGGAQ